MRTPAPRRAQQLPTVERATGLPLGRPHAEQADSGQHNTLIGYGSTLHGSGPRPHAAETEVRNSTP